MAQLIEGTGAELIAYLETQRHQGNLLLIVPMDEVADTAIPAYPEGATIRNGAPLFPTDGRMQSITMEHVQELLAEEE